VTNNFFLVNPFYCGLVGLPTLLSSTSSRRCFCCYGKVKLRNNQFCGKRCRGTKNWVWLPRGAL